MNEENKTLNTETTEELNNDTLVVSMDNAEITETANKSCDEYTSNDLALGISITAFAALGMYQVAKYIVKGGKMAFCKIRDKIRNKKNEDISDETDDVENVEG